MSTLTQLADVAVDYWKSEKRTILDHQKAQIVVAGLYIEDLDEAIKFLEGIPNVNFLIDTDTLFPYLCRIYNKEFIGYHISRDQPEVFNQLLKSWCDDPSFVFFATKPQKEAVARRFVQEAYANISHVIRDEDSTATPATYAILDDRFGIKGKGYFDTKYIDLGHQMSNLIIHQMIGDALNGTSSSNSLNVLRQAAKI